MSKTNLLQAKNISKTFTISQNPLTRKAVKVNAVNNVSLTIQKGETIGLVGESGCGKSTFGRLLLRLLPATSGQVLFHDSDIYTLSNEKMRQLRQKMQIIFQDPYSCLNPRMNVLETVRAPLDVFQIGTDSERTQRVKEILEVVGLGEHHLMRYPHEFSGGQRQRIGIARALISKPEFIVCDEPVSALDVSVRASVLNLMSRLQQEFNLTYLFISHDLSVVKHISARVAVMYLGSIVEIAAKDTLYKSPLHPYTKALLASILPPDPKQKKEYIPLKGEMPTPYSPPAGCKFHTRCPYCTERCCQEIPELKDVGGGHFAACHLYA